MAFRCRLGAALDGFERAIRHQAVPREVERQRAGILKLFNEILALWIAAIQEGDSDSVGAILVFGLIIMTAAAVMARLGPREPCQPNDLFAAGASTDPFRPHL